MTDLERDHLIVATAFGVEALLILAQSQGPAKHPSMSRLLSSAEKGIAKYLKALALPHPPSASSH